MEKKSVSKPKVIKPPRNFREEIPDYTIDLSKLEILKKVNLTEDGKITKFLLDSGKGSESRAGDLIYYSLEARYPNGDLINPKLDRKGISKISVKGGSNKTYEMDQDKKLIEKIDESMKIFEISLNGTKFGETFWVKVSGKLLYASKFYKESLEPIILEQKQKNPQENPSENNTQLTEIWIKFSVIRVKHQFSKIYYDYESLRNCIKESKILAREYVELGKIDNEVYYYALEIYKYWIQIFKQLPKKVKETLTPENNKEIELEKLSLYMNIAIVNVNLEHFIEAKEYAENAIEIDPNNVKAAYWLGVACIHREEFQERAFQAFKICFDKEPMNQCLQKFKKWYDRFKAKKDGIKKSHDPWKAYKKLIERDELNNKLQRKTQRTGENVNIEENENSDSSSNENFEEENKKEQYPIKVEDSLWYDIIKEEEEKKKKLEETKQNAEKIEETKK